MLFGEASESLRIARAIGRGDIAEAISRCEKLVQKDATNLFAWSTLAECLLGSGDSARAALAAERALEIDPAAREAAMVAARARFELGDHAATYAAVKRFLRLAEQKSDEASNGKLGVPLAARMFPPLAAETARREEDRRAALAWATEFARWYEAQQPPGTSTAGGARRGNR